MIGYICKYTPVEVLSALGASPVRIEPNLTNFDISDAWLHPNMCSYAKAILEEMATLDYEGVVLTSCCDSIRRLYDALIDQFPEKFIYMLDLPRKADDMAVRLYADEIDNMVHAYEEFSQASFNRSCLIELVAAASRHSGDAAIQGAGTAGLRVGIVGARYNSSIARVLEECGVTVGFDITCAGLQRDLGRHRASDLEALDDEELLALYTRHLLDQLPCMRQVDASARRRFIEKRSAHVDGIVYHTVKFCDIYAYEYVLMRDWVTVPMLKIETDALRQSAGQIRTRVEAFVESLREAKGIERSVSARPRLEHSSMYTLGIDSGSTSTDAAILDDESRLVASMCIRTGAKSIDSARRLFEEVLNSARLSRSDIAAIVATGYGRISVDFADLQVTEISCHARGAHWFNPDIRTILDIGGQDSKAIRLDSQGNVADFAMNDKCAAGTGRFLEAMARTLEVDVTQLGPLSLESKRRVEVTSMCTVFAESEVITLIAEGTERADIAAGVHRAIAGKSRGLMQRVHHEPFYMMTGGVARNTGVVAAIEESLGAPLFICDKPDIVGAVGAALIARDQLS